MSTATNLVTREDTLLGVCQGLGEDFRFNPNGLRIALASVLLVSPMAAIGAYLVLGLALLIGRWSSPVRVAVETPAVAAPATVDDAVVGSAIAGNDDGVAFAKAA